MQQDKSSTNELFNYFRITNEIRKQEIEDALLFFESIPNSFAAVCSFETNRFIFISPMAEKLLGYPIQNFLDGGYQFLFQLIPEWVIPKMIAWQSGVFKIMSAPEFDYTAPFLIDFKGALFHANKAVIELYQTAIVTEFEPGGNTRTFFSLWIERPKEKPLRFPLKKALLHHKMKEFHRLLLGPHSEKRNRESSTLIKIKAPHVEAPVLTKKEKELLLLLSQGLELKVIAEMMQVSYFTSETHRKHLFKKFEVRNVAQLIQKASKVYWLE